MGNTLPRMSDEELREFIRDFIAGRIFCSAHMNECEMQHVQLVFLPLAFGVFSGWTEEELEQVGIVWEYLEKAGPRCVNGMPMFFSVHLMHRLDWKRAAKVIMREQQRMQELSLDDDEEEEDEARSELEVALDVVQDGTASVEVLQWALGILEQAGVMMTPLTVFETMSGSGGASKSGSRSRSWSWSRSLSGSE